MSSKLMDLTTQFLTFMNNLRELFLKHQPSIWKLVGTRGFPFHKDPYGKYYNGILFIGNESQCTMSQYAEFFNLSPATATGIIDKMVKKKFVERVENLDDRRKVEIKLTELGQFVYEKAKEFEKNQIKSLMNDFSEEEIELTLKILKKLNGSPVFPSNS